MTDLRHKDERPLEQKKQDALTALRILLDCEYENPQKLDEAWEIRVANKLVRAGLLEGPFQGMYRQTEAGQELAKRFIRFGR